MALGLLAKFLVTQWDTRQRFQKQSLMLPWKHVLRFQGGAVGIGMQNQSDEHRVSQGCSN